MIGPDAPPWTDDDMTPTPIKDVSAEREKQRAKWGDSHDDEHQDAALSAAAAFLAWPADRCFISCPKWVHDILKKHSEDRRKQLVIAASLIIAEIERLDRMEREKEEQIEARDGATHAPRLERP